MHNLNSYYVEMSSMEFSILDCYHYFRKMAQAYLCDFSAQAIPIHITQDDIEEERQNSDGDYFSDAMLETFAIMSKMAKIFLNHNRMLIHGACISYENQGFLFSAPSGTGKTTHISLWRDYLGDAVRIVNGDKPVLSFDDEILAHGTPWAGKEGYQENSSVPLSKLIILKRAERNSIERISPYVALPDICQSIFLMQDPECAGLILEKVDQLIQKVPIYQLNCDMSEEAVKCSFEALTGLNYEERKIIHEN